MATEAARREFPALPEEVRAIRESVTRLTFIDFDIGNLRPRSPARRSGTGYVNPPSAVRLRLPLESRLTGLGLDGHGTVTTARRAPPLSGRL